MSHGLESRTAMIPKRILIRIFHLLTAICRHNRNRVERSVGLNLRLLHVVASQVESLEGEN